MADREGRLEDRALRICAEVFPYRRNVTERKTNTMLQWLHDNGFIVRYELDGRRYIQVIEFLTHQNPHKNEAPSKIPALTFVLHHTNTGVSTVQTLERSCATTEQAPYQNGSTPASSLNPSSLNPSSLNPSSLNPSSQTTRAASIRELQERAGTGLAGTESWRGGNGIGESPAVDSLPFEQSIQARFPRGTNASNWTIGIRNARRVVELGLKTWPELADVTERYAVYFAASGQSANIAAHNFFDPDPKGGMHWAQPWDPPKTKGQIRQDANIDAARTWLAQSEGT